MRASRIPAPNIFAVEPPSTLTFQEAVIFDTGSLEDTKLKITGELGVQPAVSRYPGTPVSDETLAAMFDMENVVALT